MDYSVRKKEILLKHIGEITPIFDEINAKNTPYIYFIDQSFLLGNYSSITQDELTTWNLITAELNSKFKGQNSRLVTRLIPIVKRDYSELEINLIKHSLSIQLAQGIRLCIIFTENNNFLHSHFGTDNLVLINGRKLISCPKFWEAEEPTELIIESSFSRNISHIYAELNSIIESQDTHNLCYNTDTYTSYKLSLKKKYGHFLFDLQNGKCSITKESLSINDWDVDHIFPIGMGGNNSLVNLRAIMRKENGSKSAKITEVRYCLSPQELKTFNLTCDYHRKFSDRKLVNIPLGVKALNFRDPMQF